MCVAKEYKKAENCHDDGCAMMKRWRFGSKIFKAILSVITDYDDDDIEYFISEMIQLIIII